MLPPPCLDTRHLVGGQNEVILPESLVLPHAGIQIRHTDPERPGGFEREVTIAREIQDRAHFHLTPVGSSWINQIETWLGIITASPSGAAPSPPSPLLIKQIRGLHQPPEQRPQAVHLGRHHRRNPRQGSTVQTSIKKLVDNNAKQIRQNHRALDAKAGPRLNIVAISDPRIPREQIS